jgi:hypothetical protein
MKKLVRSLVFIFLWASLATAQTATATRNVKLYPHPSQSDKMIAKLTKGTQVQLVEPDPTDGYYHVQTSDSQSGYAWAKFLKVQEVSAPAPSTTPSPSPTSVAVEGLTLPVCLFRSCLRGILWTGGSSLS